MLSSGKPDEIDDDSILNILDSLHNDDDDEIDQTNDVDEDIDYDSALVLASNSRIPKVYLDKRV
jgi:hypothetical protein